MHITVRRQKPRRFPGVRQQLANRSYPAWLGVLKPGYLEVYPIGMHSLHDAKPITSIQANSERAPTFFQSLVHGTFAPARRTLNTDFVYNKIFNLLTRTVQTFVPKKGPGRIAPIEVLSMAGRALFFRFLIDRKIVLESELCEPDGICPKASDLKDAFSTAEKAAATSAWLDATFNGDFLPLINETIPASNRERREIAYLKFYDSTKALVGKTIFTHLQAILRGWNSVGDDFQPEFDWGDFDFAHIPVGVLSQVHESFGHRVDPNTARETSVHYTPRTIARLMVDEAFAAVKEPADAKVLDSACGAGIFLVLAFRRLVRERWLRDDKRPETREIQQVLYNQLRGFDISESALRLAALSLYITAIELNATPRPPHSLKFPRNLRGTSLFHFGPDDEDIKRRTVFPLGSLGPNVPVQFDHQFDIVIGNPPWTRLRDRRDSSEPESKKRAGQSPTDEVNAAFTKIGRRVLKQRGLLDLAAKFENPDKNPDVPFLWRAMEWAKDGAIIALAMPARLFGRTTGGGFETWRAILRSVQVTGLISGADMRWSSVWAGVKVPFCVFFAKNKLPSPKNI